MSRKNRGGRARRTGQQIRVDDILNRSRDVTGSMPPDDEQQRDDDRPLPRISTDRENT